MGVKVFLYNVFRRFMRFALFCYYGEIRIDGLKKIPPSRPLLLLPNHQNALMDPLLIAAFSTKRKPFFLTRADVFSTSFLKRIFSGFRMIPVYRLRDGRNTLQHNHEIFDRCSKVLTEGEVLLLFPEANHNLKRRVRGLSKGFTRIVMRTLNEDSETRLGLLPIGINYKHAAGFPDRVAFSFGPVIEVVPECRGMKEREAAEHLKLRVSESLKKLTTHIPNEEGYEDMVHRINEAGLDWTRPEEVNRFIGTFASGEAPVIKSRKSSAFLKLWDFLFRFMNFPVILPWRWLGRAKNWDMEFNSTFRFAYALVVYPIFYLLLFLICWGAGHPLFGLILIPAHFLINLVYVKFR